MAGFRTIDSDGQPVREMYDGTGMVSKAVRALGAKFRGWGREAQGLPAAEPVIDLSQQTAALNAWDERQRYGDTAPAAAVPVAASVAAVKPVVVAQPAARVSTKPAAAAPKSLRKVVAARQGVVAQPDEEGMRGWVQGADGVWGPPAAAAAAAAATPSDAPDMAGYGEYADGTNRLYAGRSELAPAAAVVSAERDTSLDPGSQGAWAREENARNLLKATGGARGLAALGAYDTAQLAPMTAQIKAAGDVSTKRMENEGRLAETDLKGKYDNNGNLITAAGNKDVAIINGRALIGGKTLDLEGTKFGATAKRDADVESAVIGAGSRVTAAKIDATKNAGTSEETRFKTIAADLMAQEKAINESLTLKPAEKIAQLAIIQKRKNDLYK